MALDTADFTGAASKASRCGDQAYGSALGGELREALAVGQVQVAASARIVAGSLDE